MQSNEYFIGVDISSGMLWYDIYLPLITPIWNKSSASVLAALSFLEPILCFEVGKTLVYRGKLVRLQLLGNFQ